ncbi:hypothetical protein EV368DRAFT_84230 [Lentinula lateritia]|nr:hypothetical protein EV368DRAFT_84230 [Lentinula lateritia]
MRFHTVIVISSFLATVFAAPHIQQKYDMNTSLEPRVYHAVATSSKTSGQPSATAKPGLAESDYSSCLSDTRVITESSLLSVLYNEEDVGKKTIRDSEGPDWELEYFNYSLKYYKGQNDLILREFGKDRLEDFLKEVEKVKAAKRYVDSGIHYDSSKSTSVPKLFRPYTYVIILTTSTSKAGMSFLEDPSDDESPGAMEYLAKFRRPRLCCGILQWKNLDEIFPPRHYFEEDPEVQTQTTLMSLSHSGWSDKGLIGMKFDTADISVASSWRGHTTVVVRTYDVEPYHNIDVTSC